jgi:hypothetical protein
VTTLLVVPPTRLPFGLRSDGLSRSVMICALLTGSFKSYKSTNYHCGIFYWYNNGVKNDAFQALLIQLWMDID